MKPLLIFDGDCNFCRRWVERWKIFTGDEVEYAAYQEAAGRFPQISASQFQSSVQLIEGESVFSGAEAVFRSLAYNPQKRWPLWLYRHLPLFRGASEAFYEFVASHRVLFSKITKFLWGSHLAPSSYFLTRRVFLVWLGVIYFIAFASLGFQVEGLLAEKGILPVRDYFEAIHQKVGWAGVRLLPSLAWFDSSDAFLKFLCWGGAALSVLLILGLIPSLVLFLLWLFYLSLVAAGQNFLSFQWDNLLLEAGFLAIFFSPLSRTFKNSLAAPSRALHGLFKWLLFRLMFSSGFIKLASQDPTWRNLTALTYHYETQPLPVPASWYIDQLPVWFHKLSALVVFGVELLVPFLIFAPRRLRHMGCFILILFQVFIFATGNYCFFNLLTIGLCLLLLDDSFWKRCGGFLGIQRFFPEEAVSQKQIGRWSGLLVFGIAGFMYIASSSIFLRTLKPQLDFPKGLEAFINLIRPFRSVNHYGLFAVMTTSRPEIIVEGSADGETWEAYEFKYKSGDPLRAPRFVQPHQPRLDWQMWFAALGNYYQNPWFVYFCVRLLEGEPAVLRLLEKNPFPDQPPKYVRAFIYNYRFTDPEEKRSTKAWWKRERGDLYLPVLSLKDLSG